MRTLLLAILIFNVTFGAAWSVLVLYASERLGLGPIGFGLITTVQAVGGLVATAFYGRLADHVRLGTILRVGLIVETLTHIGLALTTSPPVAMVIFFCFGAHAFIWGTTSTTLRQRVTPLDLQGRVGAAYKMGVNGGLVVGAGIGGLLAREFGVTGPFWFAGVGSAVFVVLIWRALRHLDGAEPAPDTPAEPPRTPAPPVGPAPTPSPTASPTPPSPTTVTPSAETSTTSTTSDRPVDDPPA